MQWKHHQISQLVPIEDDNIILCTFTHFRFTGKGSGEDIYNAYTHTTLWLREFS